MKRCSRCKLQLPETAFNKLTRSSDGLQPRCRVCDSICNTERYAAKGAALRAQVKAYRDANPDKIKAAKRAWKNSPTGRAARRADKCSPKGRARAAAQAAVRTGKLIPGPCEQRGSDCKGQVEAHHASYAVADRLKVNWLCNKHHRDAHS